MSEQNGKFSSTENPPVELSVKNLQNKKSHNNNKKNMLRSQSSRPPKNSVKIKPIQIQIHYKWALILTILCFFLIGPCWALYKTRELRRMIAQNEIDQATHLSKKISGVLVISTVIGVVVWVSILFCSAGLLLTGMLLKKHSI